MKSRLIHTTAASLVAALLAAAVPAPATAAEAGQPRAVTMRTRTMGTWASLTLVTADSAAVADLARDALLEFHRVDSLMTNWTDISEVARLNREATAGPVNVQPEVAEVLRTAVRIGRDSGGAFDLSVEPLVRLWGFLGGTPQVPGDAAIDATRRLVGWQHVSIDTVAGTLALSGPGVRIDLGGIAKGYGVDLVAARLRAAGVEDALVDLSGNMMALGSPPGRPAWTIGIRDPGDAERHLGTLKLTGTAVATSGSYEQFVAAGGRRYGHILDPRTGWPAEGLLSVTVVTARAVDADAWATALFVLGPDAARATAAARADLAAVLLQQDAEGRLILWVESALVDRFTPAAGLETILTIRTF